MDIPGSLCSELHRDEISGSDHAVIISAFHPVDELFQRALYSLRAQSDQDFDTIVVVDDPADNKIVDRIVNCENPPGRGYMVVVTEIPTNNFARLRNIGSFMSDRATFLHFLDDDNVLSPGAIAQRRNVIEQWSQENDDVDLLTTPWIISSGAHGILFGLPLTEKKELLMSDGAPDVGHIEFNPFEGVHMEMSVVMFPGAVAEAMTVRRSKLIELGGWDESFQTCSDIDLHCRLIMAGAVVANFEKPTAILLSRCESKTPARDRSEQNAEIDLVQRKVESWSPEKITPAKSILLSLN